jgi:hypothetical protein
MNETVSDSAGIPPRGEVKPKPPFFWLGNEIFDVFLPIMGADCFTIYAYFTRRIFSDPKLKHSIREVAGATKLSPATVFRSLEILEYLRLIKLVRFQGGKGSECQLLEAKEVANCLGAEYHPKTLSFSLPPNVAQRLKVDVKALRKRQQGKSSQTAPRDCGNSFRAVSQRNASVSPPIRQRSVRETQTQFHLLEERRIEIIPTPTPSRECELQKPKGFPDEVRSGDDLTWARAKFDGVMKDMKSHLFDGHRPPLPHLTNGFADWQEFGFKSLAVERTAWRGKVLTLVLSASDPAAARRGLEKYRRKWDASLLKWYEREVRVELVRRSGGDVAAGENAAEC